MTGLVFGAGHIIYHVLNTIRGIVNDIGSGIPYIINCTADVIQYGIIVGLVAGSHVVDIFVCVCVAHVICGAVYCVVRSIVVGGTIGSTVSCTIIGRVLGWSGTAITLAEGILAETPSLSGWANYAPGIGRAAHRTETPEAAADTLVIRSVREGDVPGIHTVTYESEDDMLQLRHTIKNRRTLALGAVIAAEFLCGRRGVYSMDDLLRTVE